MCGTLSLNIESAKTQGVKLCYVVSYRANVALVTQRIITFTTFILHGKL